MIGIVESFRDRTYFAQGKVNPDLDIIRRGNGADLDPDVLYTVGTNLKPA